MRLACMAPLLLAGLPAVAPLARASHQSAWSPRTVHRFSLDPVLADWGPDAAAPQRLPDVGFLDDVEEAAPPRLLPIERWLESNLATRCPGIERVAFRRTIQELATSDGETRSISRELEVEGANGAFVGPVPVAFLIFALAVPAVWFYLERTVSGRAAFALGVNKEAVRLAGVDVGRHLIFAYVLLMSLPLVVVLAVAQRKIISGITGGAVK